MNEQRISQIQNFIYENGTFYKYFVNISNNFYERIREIPSFLIPFFSLFLRSIILSFMQNCGDFHSYANSRLKIFMHLSKV